MLTRTPSLPKARTDNARSAARAANSALFAPRLSQTKLPWASGTNHPSSRSPAVTRSRSPLLRRFLDLRSRVTDMHVMLQSEVAERIAAPPGGKEYGILSVLYALYADATVALRFRPGAFAPPPNVSSALLRVRFLQQPRAEVPDLPAFERLVQRAFSRRRKTLENNLQDSYANLKEYLRLVHIEGSRRAETLSVVEFARLAVALAKA